MEQTFRIEPVECNCEEREKQENIELYGEDAMRDFPELIAQVIMNLVNLGFTLKKAHVMDTMAALNFDLRDERHVSIHFHPNKKLSYVLSFAAIARDPEQTTDVFHQNNIALCLHRDLGLDISRL